MSRRPLRPLVVLAALAATWVASGALVAWNLTRRAVPPFPEPPPPGWASVSLASADGTLLGGWLRRGRMGTPCVLALHGNGSARSRLHAELAVLSEDDTCVLALSLRAHGDSGGEVNDGPFPLYTLWFGS